MRRTVGCVVRVLCVQVARISDWRACAAICRVGGATSARATVTDAKAGAKGEVSRSSARHGRCAGAGARSAGYGARRTQFSIADRAFASCSSSWSSSSSTQRARVKLEVMATRSRRLWRWEGGSQRA